jgi:hypothetical protein
MGLLATSLVSFRMSNFYSNDQISRAASLPTGLISFRSKAAQVLHKFCGGFQPRRLRGLIYGNSVFRCTEFLPAPTTLAPGCVSGLGSSRQQACLIFLFACVHSSVVSLE